MELLAHDALTVGVGGAHDALSELDAHEPETW
jgi:hypothetical protein